MILVCIRVGVGAQRWRLLIECFGRSVAVQIAPVQASIRINATTGVAIDAENFGEAVKAVNTALNAVEVPSTIKALVTRPEATSLTDKSDKFWILVNAI